MTPIRRMAKGDVPALAGVLARSYASSEDALRTRLYAALRQRGLESFVAEVDGALAGMVLGHDYGAIAWVALMGVEPAMQRRGVGDALMRALLAWADARAFAAVELFATPAGRPLYLRHGFVDADEAQVWNAPAEGGDASAARDATSADRDAILALDRESFGADREPVLSQLLDDPANRVFALGTPSRLEGFAIAECAAAVLGPVIARDPESAARLLEAARVAMLAPHRLNITGSAENAALVASRGYVFDRSARRMIRGALPPAARERILARINLGHG